MVIQLVLLLLLTTFYGTYFAKQLLLRKKGIVTNRLAKGQKPNRTKRIETGLLLCTYLTACIQYFNVCFWRSFLPLHLPTFVRTLGLVLAGAGVLFFLLATTMLDNWRAGVDETQKTEMVHTGVYHISRNPAFMGFDFLYLGSFLAFPSLLMLAAALASVVFIHLQILEEEKYLPTVFGKAYLIYKKQTPRHLLF